MRKISLACSFAVACAALITACGGDALKTCRPGTVLVAIPCDPSWGSAPQLHVDVTRAGKPDKVSAELPSGCPGGSTMLEVVLQDYANTSSITVTAAPSDDAAKAVTRVIRVTRSDACTNALGDNADGGPSSSVDGPVAGHAGDGGVDQRPAPPACTADMVGGTIANGSACSCDAQCASGVCADGVCCATKCGGTCMACDLPGSMGICSPVPQGSPPTRPGECTKDAVETCGADGTCDGAGACRKYPDGTSCGAGRCEGAAVVGGKQCVNGSCQPGAKVVCAPFGCDMAAGKCLDKCQANEQCDTGRSCKDASCGVKPPGAVCAKNEECESQHCTDGVCCNTACDGECVACNQAGHMGECLAVAKGAADPHGVCKDQGASSCGTNGRCDGERKCAKYAAGITCADASCSSGSKVPASTCDGNGTCVHSDAVGCAPFMCAAGACLQKCTKNEDCVAPATCDATGSCGKKGNGQPCAAGDQCMSGNCVDGVCCDKACNGACEACNLGSSLGRCTAVGAGAPDPHGMCKDKGKATCQENGLCNGAGGCQMYAAGTACGSESCAGDSYTPAPTCDGGGTCKAAAATACAPYHCASALRCASSCTIDADCVSPKSCLGNSCGQLPNGRACSNDNQCESGFCVDGTCCESSCNGACRSCNNSQGKCTMTAAGVGDPRSVCTDKGAASCKENGKCNGSGGCQLYGSGTVCAAGSCSNDVQTNPSTCDGAGTCKSGGTTPCGNIHCGVVACLSSCNDNSQCVAPNVCNGGNCGKKPNGLACTAAGECQSGNCVDGHCCGVASCGTCESCGNTGACVPVAPGMPDPHGRCTDKGPASCKEDGACNGSGACRLYASGTSCASEACSADVHTNASICDGNGACSAGAMQNCSPYHCNGTVCRTTCGTDADCINSSFYCSGGKCSAKHADGVACAGSNECTSGTCTQYWTDNDGDGHGASGSSSKFCGSGALAGYARDSRDCCDSDAGSHPPDMSTNFQGFPLAKTVKNACGSWDYDCSNSIDLWGAGVYPGVSACKMNGLDATVRTTNQTPVCGTSVSYCFCNTDNGMVDIGSCIVGDVTCF